MSRGGAALFRFDRSLLKRFSLPPQDSYLIGIDEAGRGPLAGPVVAAAVVLPQDFREPRLNDSKQISPPVRERIYRRLLQHSFWAVGCGQVEEIDSVNILRATHLAMHQALRNLLRRYPSLSPSLILIDGLPIPPTGFPQEHLVDGDALSASIAAASVVAKCFRDRLMRTLARLYPSYGFEAHKGYATARHFEALSLHGPSRVHRRSFTLTQETLELVAEDEG